MKPPGVLRLDIAGEDRSKVRFLAVLLMAGVRGVPPVGAQFVDWEESTLLEDVFELDLELRLRTRTYSFWEFNSYTRYVFRACLYSLDSVLRLSDRCESQAS
jgi:hypothetical protein